MLDPRRGAGKITKMIPHVDWVVGLRNVIIPQLSFFLILVMLESLEIKF